MGSDRARRVADIVDRLAGLPPDDRTAMLNRECVDDPELRAEVEARLASSADHEPTVLANGAAPTLDGDSGHDLTRRLGKYVLEERIGVGGMGEVWRALDTTLDRRIALKILPADLARHPERLERFRREAKTLAGLNHPNIVTLHSVEEADGVHFLTMELVEGRTLAEHIPDDGLPFGRWLELAVPLTEALATAHARGIIHRDLKPGNIMLGDDGRLRVLDFGLAKLLQPPSDDSLTRDLTLSVPGAIVGTAPYMSPEQIRGGGIDHRSDLFSLGIVLYEMATGRRPFHGTTVADLSSAILRDPAPDLEKIRPEAPTPLAALIGRCLEKDPDDRYQDTRELRQDLDDLVVAAARPVTVRTPRPVQRRMRNLALVALAAVAVGAVAWIASRPDRSTSTAQGARPPLRSLVVLPFENLGGDADRAYLADGITDTLTTDLATIGSLRVISHTSAVRAAAAETTTPEIAAMLDVEAVVEGSVTVEGDRVLVNVQLIDAMADTHLWAEAYDRRFENVIALQREMARAIADEIQVRLDPEAAAMLADAPTVDREAYEAYLRGRYLWFQRDREDMQRAREAFRESIDLDPVYAPAWSGLADTYLTSVAYFWEPPEVAMPKARAAAERALEIDERSAQAHASLGSVLTEYYWDWADAERHLRRAIELEPGYATAHQRYATLMMNLGRFDTAIEHARMARSLDPLVPVLAFTEGKMLYSARRWDAAIGVFDEVLEEAPGFFYARFYRALALFQRDGPAAAAAALDGMVGPRDVQGMRAIFRGLAGDPETAREFMRSLATDDGSVDPFLSASMEVFFGDPDRAVKLLEQAAAARDWRITFLAVEPMFDPIRGHPGFRTLLERVGLPILDLPAGNDQS